MIVGCVKELKPYENRVGLIPIHAQKYIEAGHEVLVEKGLGESSGYEDSDYLNVGATLVDQAETIWETADMIIKVKEPVESEYELMRENQIVFTYFHLAANRMLTEKLLERNVKAVAYETIEEENHELPLLKPMSEVAGYLAIQEGSKYLEKNFGGKGILLSGVTGVKPGRVVIVGAGSVGYSALVAAYKLGAYVSVLDINQSRLEMISDTFDERVEVLVSNEENLKLALAKADLVVSSVLLPGAKAPKLIKKDHLKLMEEGSVIVDVAIDQGGTTETSRPTTHLEPVYEVEGILHYCVSNMPGAVPRTSSIALGNATLHYGLEIANKGLEQASSENAAIEKGINTYNGSIVNKGVAEAFDLEYQKLERHED